VDGDTQEKIKRDEMTMYCFSMTGDTLREPHLKIPRSHIRVTEFHSNAWSLQHFNSKYNDNNKQF
jgi:hypothetical protein